MKREDRIIEWLQGAHAMELALKGVLENHAEHFKGQSRIADGLRQHAEQTEQHAARIQSCLESLDGAVAQGRSIMGSVMSKLEGMSTAMFEDRLIKDLLVDHAAEHFEIACYRSLVHAAEQRRLHDIAATCRDILSEEEAMASWLAELVPEVTDLLLKEG